MSMVRTIQFAPATTIAHLGCNCGGPAPNTPRRVAVPKAAGVLVGHPSPVGTLQEPHELVSGSRIIRSMRRKWS